MKQKKYLFLIISGLLLLSLSLVFKSNELRKINDLCIGFGFAMLVLGASKLINSFILTKVEDKEIKRLEVIDINDERNTRIREKTSHMTMKTMNSILFIIILVLMFMNVDKIFLFILGFLLVMEIILLMIFSNYYSKKM